MHKKQTRTKALQTQNTKEVPPWNGQEKYFIEGLKPVSQRKPHP